ANYLKELIINDCKATFENLELLLKYTPNLEIFSIFIANNMDMFDGIRWQKLIETSLKHLSVFKFHFQDKKFDKPMQKLNKCRKMRI
ncbi:unnamed protein product, partial [Adineta steineri]